MSRLTPLQRLQGTGSRVFDVLLGSPALGAVAAVHAAVTDTGSQQTITTGITNPDVPRVVTATAGGTAGDIGAIQVVINGTNYFDQVIQETLPAFTVDTAGTVTGVKAFKTVTSIVIPAHDGVGATTSIGLGAALGLPVLFSRDTILEAYLANARESTRPTVAVHATAVESNKITLNSALDGTAVRVAFFEPAT